MSEDEYLFYSKMASSAFKQAVAAGPQSATINVLNLDGTNEGFNDPSARSPEGGNSGTTLGQQRLNVFNEAAQIWGAFLDSPVTISIDAQFNPLTCGGGSAVLGSAGPTFTAANFTNAEFANTDYHIALANRQAGTDLIPSNSEISTQFNSSIDNNCLSGVRFYYGLDGVNPSFTLNLLVVVLHELGHGLGFSSTAQPLTVNAATNASPIVVTTSATHGLVSGDQVRIQNAAGNTAANGIFTVNVLNTTQFQLAGSAGNGTYTAGSGVIRGLFRTGRPGLWARFMYDDTAGLHWDEMTTAQRSVSGENTGNLYWDGPSVRIASGDLTAGRHAGTGRVQLYAPATFQQGSSVSHWSTAAFPNLLMEPSITAGLPLHLDLTRQLMRDIGWYRDTTNDNVPDTISDISVSDNVVVIGDTVDITWENSGSFSRNITIELSTDGGTTFPTAVATDIVNTGSFTWTVPNSATTQARLRVREAGYASPAGTSSANFIISLAPSSALVSVAGRVTDLNGRGIGNVLVRIDDGQGTVAVARTNAFGYYRLQGIAAGNNYVLTASHKSYQFGARPLMVSDSMTDIDLSPIP